MSMLLKIVIPFTWRAIVLEFRTGTAYSVDLANYLTNPEQRSVTYSVQGTLPTGVTLTGSLVAYNGTGPVASVTVRFLAASGGLEMSSDVTPVTIVVGNVAPQFTVAPATSSLPSTGGTIQFTAVDPDGTPVSYGVSGLGSSINSTGRVTVPTGQASGTLTVTASDGTLTTTVNCAVTVLSAASIKWHPGHYALPGANDSQATKFTLFDELGSGWQGAQVRYYWGNIESSLGVYDFSTIEADAARLWANSQKKMFIQILSARFGETTPGSLCPSYLLSPIYDDGVAVISDRVVIQVWQASVMDRIIALEDALAAYFDADDRIAGIVGGETALGANAELTPYGYSGSATLTQLNRRATANRIAWSRTPSIVYANFFSGWSAAQIQALFEHLEATGCGCGGPDIKPGDTTIGQDYWMGDVGSQDYRGIIPAGFANQNASVTGWTFAQLYAFAKNTLQAHFMFTLKSSSSVTSWTDTKAYVNANPTMVSTLPTTLG